MTWVVVACAAVAVVVIALSLRSHETPDEEPRERPPKPGEGLPRHDSVNPEGMVPIGVLANDEAMVARGLLESGGIPVAVVAFDDLAVRHHTAPRTLRILVPPEHAEEASALLHGEGLGGQR